VFLLDFSSAVTPNVSLVPWSWLESSSWWLCGWWSNPWIMLPSGAVFWVVYFDGNVNTTTTTWHQDLDFMVLLFLSCLDAALTTIRSLGTWNTVLARGSFEALSAV